MPKLATPLTDIQARNAKPKEKPYELADGGGMYLEVMPSGSRTWRMNYLQANGKKNRLTFGACPETTLAEAREKRAAARKLLNDGVAPAKARDDKNRLAAEKASHTFEKIAREWHSNKLSTWHETTAKDTSRRLELDIFPRLEAPRLPRLRTSR